MSDSDLGELFVIDALDRAHKLGFCTARIERVIEYLEIAPDSEDQYVIKLLRGALDECQRKAGP